MTLLTGVWYQTSRFWREIPYFGAKLQIDLDWKKLSQFEPKNKISVGFELSSNMHMSMHVTTIFGLSHLWPLNYSMFGSHIPVSLFMPLTFEIIHTCVSIKNTNGHEVLSDGHKYLTFVSHICFSHLWPPLSILCMAVFFCACKYLWSIYYNS